jgi:D-3-phosphoglycerate dehydrogenase
VGAVAKFKVVVTDLGYPNYDPERQQVEAIGGELVLADCHTEEALLQPAQDADGLIVRAAPVTAKVIGRLRKCRVITRYGVGVDNVDLVAATAKGIQVCNVPDYCLEDVSDHALALLLTCVRKTAAHDRRVRRGEWDIAAKDPIHRLKGRTLGFLGFGNIARTLARKVQGLQLRLIAFDPFIQADDAEKRGVLLVDLDTLLSESDFISVHAPLTKDTRHILNEAAFRKMKPTAILVNTSRGGLIDQQALAKALKEGWINSAGIDVYETEPPQRDDPLLSIENAVLTDHAGWYSEESQVELQTKAAAEVCRVLMGQPPLSCVNRAALEAARNEKK